MPCALYLTPYASLFLFPLPHSEFDFPLPHSAFRIRNSSEQLQAGRRPSPAIKRFAGSVLGYMPFQLFAPQGLKCSAAAIQGVGFGKIRRFAAQVAEGDPAGSDAGIFAIRSPAQVVFL
jgi:hypothetical protein